MIAVIELVVFVSVSRHQELRSRRLRVHDLNTCERVALNNAIQRLQVGRGVLSCQSLGCATRNGRFVSRLICLHGDGGDAKSRSPIEASVSVCCSCELAAASTSASHDDTRLHVLFSTSSLIQGRPARCIQLKD
jgi:hypothetical protein